jgi:hypothetical protein
MRTTINVPDALLDQAKQEAEKEGRTLSELVEHALQAVLLRRSSRSKPTPFRLVTFGKDGLRAGYSFARLKEIVEADDLGRIGSGFGSRAADADDVAPRR